MRHHYCSAECLDSAYMNFFQLVDQPSRKGLMKGLAQQRTKIEADWCTALPTIPPELVLKAITTEILTANPNLKPFAKSVAYNGIARQPVGTRTPKHKLKVLEQFKPTKRDMSEIEPLCTDLADYASSLLLDYSPFLIDARLIYDTIKRLWDAHQTIVMNVPGGKTLDHYISNGGTATEASETDNAVSETEKLIKLSKEDRAMLDESNKEIKVSGAGDLHIVWHPVASAVYTGQSYINHSCSPNIYYSTIDNHTHQLDVVAARPIEAGEELCASYLDMSILALPAPSRRAHIISQFGFSCECPLCTLAAKQQR